MTISSFFQLTPKEFYLALKSKNEYDGEFVEANVKMVCESIRSSTVHLLNIQIVKKSEKITNEKKIMVFPWDKVIPSKPQTREEMKSVMKTIARSTKTKKAKK